MGEKSSKRQFLVKVDGIDGYWAQLTGGGVSSEVTRAYDGGSNTPDMISAPPQAENVTLTRPYERSRDAELCSQLRQVCGSWRTTVSKQPTDQALVASGKPTVYSNALLVTITEPEVDASSGDVAEVTLEFAVGQYN